MFFIWFGATDKCHVHYTRAGFSWVSKVVTKLLWICFQFCAQWLVSKTRASFSTNEKPNQNQPWLGRTRFPALGAGYMHLLRILSSSLRCLRLLWLVRHSNENRSKDYKWGWVDTMFFKSIRYEYDIWHFFDIDNRYRYCDVIIRDFSVIYQLPSKRLFNWVVTWGVSKRTETSDITRKYRNSSRKPQSPRYRVFGIASCRVFQWFIFRFYLSFWFKVPGAVEYGISSDDIFSLNKSPGKT